MFGLKVKRFLGDIGVLLEASCTSIESTNEKNTVYIYENMSILYIYVCRMIKYISLFLLHIVYLTIVKSRSLSKCYLSVSKCYLTQPNPGEESSQDGRFRDQKPPISFMAI